MSHPARLPRLGPFRYLTAHFEGYFLCRLATDPDPTNEERGMSGYTMALVSEPPLDQVIRLQEAGRRTRLRPPARDMGMRIGVDVRSVTFDGQPWYGHPLVGAKVRLLGRNRPFRGPTFESRNNITGSDDNFGFVVDPFILQLEKEAADGHGAVEVRAVDYLDPADPKKRIWEIADPAQYGRRLPVATAANSQEVAEAIGVVDYYGYFRDRRRYLRREIEEGERRLAGLAGRERRRLEVQVEEYRSRLYQLEFWGDRVISKLGAQVSWAFDTNGPQRVRGDLLGKVDRRQPWHVAFWFGGWDGDLLTGYLRGTLSMPFRRREGA